MKVNTLWIKNMDMVSSVGKVETSTKVTTKKIFVKDMEKCFGLMARFIKVSGQRGFNMDMGV
jgi:hypothetical protein